MNYLHSFQFITMVIQCAYCSRVISFSTFSDHFVVTFYFHMSTSHYHHRYIRLFRNISNINIYAYILVYIYIGIPSFINYMCSQLKFHQFYLLNYRYDTFKVSIINCLYLFAPSITSSN